MIKIVKRVACLLTLLVMLALYPSVALGTTMQGATDIIISDGSPYFAGWALDSSMPSHPTQVNFYTDQGFTLVGQTTANVARSDVNNLTGVAGNHGFVWKIPTAYLLGTSKIYVYGISAGASDHLLLEGSPKTVPAFSNMIGAADIVTSNGQVYMDGYALESSVPSHSTQVNFYTDGPSGAGTLLIGQTTANLPRKDVNILTWVSGNHGFSWAIPNAYLNGTTNIYAYAISSGSSPHLLLSGTPKVAPAIQYLKPGDLKNLCNSNTVEAPVYIIAGQSNAAGTGIISETNSLPFWSYWDTYGYNFGYWNIGNPSPNDKVWREGSAIRTSSMLEGEYLFGPELGLAYKLQTNGSKRFYIFKAAWGSSSLLGSEPGSNNWLTRGAGGHYDTMLASYRNAATQLCQAGYRPVVKGFLWMQGESDSGAPWVSKYKAGLTKLVDQLSEDVLPAGSPFIVGKVKKHMEEGVTLRGAFWDAMRSVQDSVNGYLSKVFVIDTNSLPSFTGDCTGATNFCYIHFNTEGQIHLGYAAYDQIAKTSSPPTQATPPKATTPTATTSTQSRITTSTATTSSQTKTTTSTTSSTQAKTTASTVATRSTTNTAVASTGTKASSTAKVVVATSAKVSTSTVKYRFTSNAKLGTNSAEVKKLQSYLNTHGFTIATTGPGSPGNESTYFGGLTKAALIRYQVFHKISPAAGFFGPVTRTKMNAGE